MTEQLFVDAIDGALPTAPPHRLDWTAIEAGAGRLRRRRGAVRLSAAALGAVAVAGVTAGVGVAVTHGSSRHPALLRPAATAAVDPAQAADYWHEKEVFTSFAQPAGVQKTSTRETRETWIGHSGSSYGSPVVSVWAGSPTGFSDHLIDGASGPGISWDGMWSLPTSADGLAAYFDAHADPVELNREGARFDWGLDLLSDPGPDSLRAAAAAFMAAQPGVLASTGSDRDHRPARILMAPNGADGEEAETVFLDPATSALLEVEATSTGRLAPCGAPPNVDCGQPEPAGTPAYTIVWDAAGPADAPGPGAKPFTEATP